MNKKRIIMGTLSLENRHFTRMALFSAFRGDWGFADWVVIDNGSQQDDICSLKLEFPEVEFIRNETNCGVAPGWNKILKYGEYDFFCIFNNDIVFCKRFVPLILEFLDAHPEAGCVSPYIQDCRQDLAKEVSDKYDQIRNFYDNEQQIMAALKYTYLSWQKVAGDAFLGFDNYSKLVEEEYQGQILPQILGSCFVLRRETIQDIGYLDEDFTEQNNVGISEDFTLSWRLTKSQKWQQIMAKNIAVHHFACQTRKRDALMQKYYGMTGSEWENKRHANTAAFNQGDPLLPK